MWATVLVGLLLATACSSPVEPPPPRVVAEDDLIVILPGPGGAVGAVTVMPHAGAALVLDTPYQAARVTTETVQTETMTPAEVRALFGSALAARPPRAVTFELYFISGTDVLTPESRATLDAAMQAVGRWPVPEIAVTGYADPTGTDRLNDALSLRRATRIQQELLTRGVASSRIDVVGRGSRGATGTARDRRVELAIR